MCKFGIKRRSDNLSRLKQHKVVQNVKPNCGVYIMMIWTIYLGSRALLGYIEFCFNRSLSHHTIDHHNVIIIILLYYHMLNPIVEWTPIKLNFENISSKWMISKINGSDHHHMGFTVKFHIFGSCWQRIRTRLKRIHISSSLVFPKVLSCGWSGVIIPIEWNWGIF